MSLILALETSCDETAIAVLRDGSKLLASEVASQIALHRVTGGVVPEAASREHLRELPALLEHIPRGGGLALSEIDAFAATSGPGLASSLMIGVAVAKGLALGAGKPYLGINHLEGHLLSPFFGRPDGIEPSVGLIVSGGHTLLVTVDGFRQYERLGSTRDDAAGEAFDKVAKMLGLPYPGGPEIDWLARYGDPRRFDFPRSMLHTGGYEFSFSGLKTALRYLLTKLGLPGVSTVAEAGDEQLTADLCASFQEAVVDVLIGKTLQAARATRRTRLAVSGGVSLNSRLRAGLAAACDREGLELLLAPPPLCTDNATMIAAVADHALRAGLFTPIEADIDPNLRLLSTAALLT